MNRREFSILALTLAAVPAGCREAGPGMPKLPETATPGWVRKSLAQGAPPAGVTDAGKPECWNAQYASKGEANVWACGYAAEGSAFEAMQKGRSEADTVKFQEGRFYVVVQWRGASRDEITALVRAIQRNLKVK